MAARLTDIMARWTAPAGQVIARVSGAEFLVCMEGVGSDQEAIGRARMTGAPGDLAKAEACR